MDLDPSVVWDFAGTLVGTLKQRPRQLPATVSRVDPNGTVWLSMPGADGLVPASTTADVQADDSVTVEWWGNAYHVTGNGTSPSIGTRAASALRRATAAAAKVAGDAKSIADAVGQHFWADDNGVHVSNEDDNATGERNILMNSLGILLRQGSAWLASFSDSAVAFYDGLGNEAANIVAQFGADGATVGYADEAHTSIGADYFRMEDASGTPIIEVTTENGPDGLADANITFVNPYSTAPFLIGSAHDIAEIVGLYEVLGGGTYGDLIEVPTFAFPDNYKVLQISTVLTVGKTYTVKCRTLDTLFTATLGTRATEADGWSYPTGDGSVVLGRDSIASALASFAAGEHVVSNFNAQAALGRYNAIDGNGDYALIIGNGTADDARSNAFAVRWDGTICPNDVPMTDYIIEQGTSGIWTYRKWSSGIAECWGAYTASIAVSTAATAYGGYRSGNISGPDYPSALFVAAPCVTATVSTSQGIWINNLAGSTATKPMFYLSCGVSLSASDRTVDFHASGRWK